MSITALLARVFGIGVLRVMPNAQMLIAETTRLALVPRVKK
jgi:hypothetical protein